MATEVELLDLEINGLAGRLCQLKLERFRLRVEDIKEAIQDSTGVPALEQRLFLGSLELIRAGQLAREPGPVEVLLVRRTAEQLKWLQVLSKEAKKYQNAPPDVQRDKEIIQSVLNQDWRLLKHVPAELKEEIEIVEIALESGAPATRVVPDALRSCRSLAKLAVKYDGSALKHFEPEVMDKELVMAAVERYPSAFDFIPEVFHQDRDVLFSAVQQEGTCLEYASAKLRGDKELVLAAVRQEGMALEYASEELKADRPVVLEAVTMDGCALQFASHELRTCPRVIRRALNSDGLALEFADEKMRDSKDLVLMAIESDPRAFEFASDGLRHDSVVIQEALKRATKGYARARVGPLSEVASDKAQEEAQLLMRLSQECPQILRCYDFRLMSTTLPMLELMLEFAPLGDLSWRIRRHKEWCSETTEVAGMPESEVVSYGSDIAAGLSYLHHLRPKILHRDIKPANILLFEEEVIPRAKLADFGIAKILELENSMAGAATVIGTPHYFAPELCRGEQYDDRADSWALGCILYEMLCLQRPFHQAEGNLAILAVRISEGKFDRAALEKQAEHYNGGLILALTGLLCPGQEQRTRARDVLESLQRLQARYRSSPQHSAPASTEWWRTRLEDTASQAEDVREKSWEGSSADSWHNATLAQLEGLLSQLQSDASPSPLRPEATFGAESMNQEAARSASYAPSFSPSASSRRTPAASPGRSQEPHFGSEPGTEYLGEAVGRWSPLTTPSSSAKTPPCRSAWGEVPTFGSPLGEPAANDRTRPPTSPLTRIFLRPLQRHDTTRPREGKWHCSEISEDEVIFCFAPAEAASKASPGASGGSHAPPPSPRATMAGWQEVEVPKATLRPEAVPSDIFALTSVT